jgi:hypothetical protein
VLTPVDDDDAVLDVGALLDAASFPAARRSSASTRGCDPVDRQQSELAEQGLVVYAAEGGGRNPPRCTSAISDGRQRGQQILGGTELATKAPS